MNEKLEILDKRFEKAVNKIFNFESLIFKSEELIDKNEFEQARGLLLSILNIDEFQPDALNNMGVIEMLSNNYEAAAKYFNRLLEVDPDNEIAKQNFECLAKMSINT